MLKFFITKQHGVTAIEYALIVGLIAIVIVASVTVIGHNLAPKYSSVAIHVT